MELSKSTHLASRGALSVSTGGVAPAARKMRNKSGFFLKFFFSQLPRDWNRSISGGAGRRRCNRGRFLAAADLGHDDLSHRQIGQHRCPAMAGPESFAQAVVLEVVELPDLRFFLQARDRNEPAFDEDGGAAVFLFKPPGNSLHESL
jgi:hypothetical protein